MVSADSPTFLDADSTGEAPVYSSAELLPLVYQELRRLAARQLRREQPGITLTPTALVHEAYVRLAAAGTLPGLPGGSAGSDPSLRRAWGGRAHFLAAAAQAMRRILVDAARRRRTLKNGRTHRRRPLPEAILDPSAPAFDVLVLDEALTAFEAVQPRKAELVQLHHFAGLTIPEAAEAMGISQATAERWWAYARAWLYDRLGDGPNNRAE